MQIAMDIMALSAAGDLAGVAVASGDLDFLAPLERARSESMKGLLLTCSRGASMPAPLEARNAAAAAGVELVSYSLNADFVAPTHSTAISIRGGAATVHESIFIHASLRAPLEDDARVAVARILEKYGYLWPDAVGRELCDAAIVKFFHVNELGPVAINPSCLGWHHLSALLKSKPSTLWLKDPGNLLFVVPSSEKNGLKYYHFTYPGPFILQDSDQVVPDILGRLGFLRPDVSLEEAIDDFNRANVRRLKTKEIEAQGAANASPVELLQREFRIRIPFMQGWRVPQSDSSLRDMLHNTGLLADQYAPEKDVDYALRRFLEKKGQVAPPLGCSYTRLVAQVHQLQNPDTESSRA
ncbi:unnamed protein product [Polarella glacialis]|uniref:Uncharacterized protein n=1 Tax=Polarella glacialis TaxID=89957 RepID=A0A813IB73_POLGL|nr:unnamed protein product [Polarella glacialis]